jgi:5'-nucleotidase
MSFNRRSFIRSNALIAGALLLSDTADALASVTRQINTVSASLDGIHIFHTNDMSGQVARGFNGFGGLHLFRENIASQEFQGILLDGGGFLNKEHTAGQHREFVELMGRTGYHAATIGEAELGFGEQHLAELATNLLFDLVNCNYEFSNPVLKQTVKPYVVLKYGKKRIGVTGVGPNVDLQGVGFNDPSKSLSRITRLLREQEHCDIVVCLAHLGFEGENNNLTLAANTEGVNFIIGGNISAAKGHGTSVVKNKAGYDVFVSHTASRASVFNHTSFAANNIIQVRTGVPGIKSRNAGFRELAKLSTSFNDHTLV